MARRGPGADAIRPCRARPWSGRTLWPCLLASTALLCGADWEGRYEGSDAGSYTLTLREAEAGSGLTVHFFRVALADDPAECQLRVLSCPAQLDADGAGFRAGPCLAELAGDDAASCSGSLDLFLRGTQEASESGLVTAVRVRSTLNDWPVVLERTLACGLGFELVGLAPLLWIGRRRRRRARRPAPGPGLSPSSSP